METKAYKIFGIKVFERSLDTQSENRSSVEGVSMSSVSDKLLALLNLNGTTDAGVSITRESSIALPAVWRAVNVLSGSIASLPLHVYENMEKGRKLNRQHPAFKLLRKPNKLMTDFIWRETMQAVLLLWGNSYSYIRRNSKGDPIELILIHPDDVTVFKNSETKFYNIKLGSDYIIAPSKDMIHLVGLSFDGLEGKSVITVMRESLGLTTAAQKFGAKFFGNGANLSGVLEAPGILSDEVINRLRSSWNSKYKGINNASETAILEGGMKYTRIGVPPEDAQFLQTRQFQVVEIARMFGVQPHLLMDLEKSTNNNIEHQSIEFVTYTLQPWLARWESEMNTKLFSASDTHYAEFNLNGLLRGDAKSRAEYYRTMFSIAAISPEEIRELENLAPYPGSEEHFVQAGYMPISMSKEFYQNKSKKDEPKPAL